MEAGTRNMDNVAYAPLDLWGLHGQTSELPNKNTASRFFGIFAILGVRFADTREIINFA